MGIGGLKKDALVFDAKNNLYKKVKLKSGQALTNTSVDFKREFYLVFSRTKVIVTAEIVDFNPNINSEIENDYDLKERNDYKVGEIVFVKINGEYEKRKIENLYLKKLQIEASEIESSKLPFFGYDEAFKVSGDFEYKNSTYTIGYKIEIVKKRGKTPSGSQKIIEFDGEVLGIAEKYALLFDKSKNLHLVIDINQK